MSTNLYHFGIFTGWAPKSFVSSRAQRVDGVGKQKPEDFMDDEVKNDYALS
jgi:hypothetical protein